VLALKDSFQRKTCWPLPRRFGNHLALLLPYIQGASEEVVMVRATAVATGLAVLFGVNAAQQESAASQVDSSVYTCGTARIRKVMTISGAADVSDAFGQLDQSASDAAASTADRQVGFFMVTVQFDGRFYVIRARTNVSWNLNPLTLGRDESLSVCVNATEMVLDRGDGSDFRGKVIRIQRDAAPFKSGRN
jgi:hypothetical protein